MPIVEIDVPHYYEATYVPAGKRKEVDGIFGGMMKVEVESVSSDEAFAVLTVTDGFSRDREPKVYRTYQGEFYVVGDTRSPVTLDTVDAAHLYDYP